jgi:hypothetical protein
MGRSIACTILSSIGPIASRRVTRFAFVTGRTAITIGHAPGSVEVVRNRPR